MLWFLIVLVLAVSVGIAVSVDDISDGVACFVGIAFIGAIIAVLLNTVVGSFNWHHEARPECNLTKVGDSYLALDLADGNKLYYRCEKDTSFIPNNVDPAYVRVVHGDKPTLVIKHVVNNNKWLSWWNADGYDEYIFTVPDDNVTLGLDKAPVK